MIIADPELFTTKSKPIIQTGAFVKLYNQENYKKAFKIYRLV